MYAATSLLAELTYLRNGWHGKVERQVSRWVHQLLAILFILKRLVLRICRPAVLGNERVHRCCVCLLMLMSKDPRQISGQCSPGSAAERQCCRSRHTQIQCSLQSIEMAARGL